MIMLDLTEWIMDFFIFSLAVVFSCIGVLMASLIIYAVLDWMSNKTKEITDD